MKLKTIQAGRWSIISPVLSGNGDACTFEEFYDEFCSNYEASLSGLLKMIEQHSVQGPGSFNNKQCHYVDKEEKIYQWIKGDLRLLWFADEDRIVVCLHGILKKSQQTPKRDVNKAVRIKNDYLDAKARKSIRIEEE